MLKGVRLEYFCFQAEDGIRDIGVTGVQTCALPIFGGGPSGPGGIVVTLLRDPLSSRWRREAGDPSRWGESRFARSAALRRSEERRVGKECRSRWSPYD